MINNSSNTERQFNRLLKSKDESAMSFLFDNFGGAINGIVRRIFREPVLSDSVFEITFLHIWKNIHQYDQSNSSLFTWLVFQTRISIKENVYRLPNSISSISNKNIIDISHAYTKEQIAVALDVPLDIVNALALSAISKIKYNSSIKRTIGKESFAKKATM